LSIWNRPIEKDWASLVAGRGTTIVVGLGIVLRVAEYLWNRSLWMDELSLASNIRGKSLSGLLGPLWNVQLAPPGFLAIEWLLAHAWGGGRYALRFFPLVSGIASLFLFERVARRGLGPRAALIAMVFFAISDDLIYYASELKPYSSDVALGLACWLVALWVRATTLTVPRFVLLGVFAAAVVWFSYPALFVLAGAGTTLVGSALAARQWRRVAVLALLGLIVAVSFAGVYAVALNQLDHRRDMWAFWNFAFPPLPPRSLWEAAWGVRRIAYLFVNPLNFANPLGPWASALIPIVLFLTGVVLVGRRDRALLGMFVLPGLLALLASYLRLYPFHGRLILFVVPALLLFIAEGAAPVRPAPLRWLLIGSLILFPMIQDLDHLVAARDLRIFNPHGDLRPSTLDPDRFP
jgi:hypothetical protein